MMPGEVEQYEESSDEDDDDGNKVLRHIAAGREAVVGTLKDHSQGKIRSYYL